MVVPRSISSVECVIKRYDETERKPSPIPDREEAAETELTTSSSEERVPRKAQHPSISARRQKTVGEALVSTWLERANTSLRFRRATCWLRPRCCGARRRSRVLRDRCSGKRTDRRKGRSRRSRYQKPKTPDQAQQLRKPPPPWNQSLELACRCWARSLGPWAWHKGLEQPQGRKAEHTCSEGRQTAVQGSRGPSQKLQVRMGQVQACLPWEKVPCQRRLHPWSRDNWSRRRRPRRLGSRRSGGS